MITRLLTFAGVALLCSASPLHGQSTTARSLHAVIARQQGEITRLSRLNAARADTIARQQAELRSLRALFAYKGNEVEVLVSGAGTENPVMDGAADSLRAATPADTATTGDKPARHRRTRPIDVPSSR